MELDFSRQHPVAILAGGVFRETKAIVVNNSYYCIRCIKTMYLLDKQLKLSILNFVSAVLSMKSMSYND